MICLILTNKLGFFVRSWWFNPYDKASSRCMPHKRFTSLYSKNRKHFISESFLEGLDKGYVRINEVDRLFALSNREIEVIFILKILLFLHTKNI